MRRNVTLLSLALLMTIAAACERRGEVAAKKNPAQGALARVRARYPDAEVQRFRGYPFLHLKLFSVAPRRVSARCAPRWIVAADARGRVLAKKELLRQALEGLASPPTTRARLCQDMLLNQLGAEILSPPRLAARCREAKPQPSYCRDEARALITAPSSAKDRLVYWRGSCADGHPEQVVLDTKKLVVTVRSIATLLDARAYARAPVAWARKKLPELSRAARRDLLKRLRCKDPEQRKLLLERAEQDTAPEVRARALERLGVCPGKEIDTLLMKTTRRDPESIVRQRAIELLGGRPFARGVRSLLKRIHGDRRRSTGERYAALRALKAATQKKTQEKKEKKEKKEKSGSPSR